MNILDIEKGVNEFNLEDFYLQDLNGGFIIISPKQTIAMYNDDVAKETRVHSGPHGEKIEKLFQIMYPNFKKFASNIWFYPEVIEKNCIVMALNSLEGAPNIIAYPSRINQRQYEEFEKFTDYMTSINAKLAEMGKMDVMFLASDIIHMENTTDNLVDTLGILSNLVCEFEPEMEANLGITKECLQPTEIKISR